MSSLRGEQRILIVSGLISILISLVIGWILGIAMLENWPSHARLRAIHLTSLEIGFMLVLFGLLVSSVSFSARAKRWWAILLAVGSYLFYLPAILGTIWDVAGAGWTADPRNNIIFLLGLIGTLLVSVAVPALTWGIVVTRRQGETR